MTSDELKIFEIKERNRDKEIALRRIRLKIIYLKKQENDICVEMRKNKKLIKRYGG